MPKEGYKIVYQALPYSSAKFLLSRPSSPLIPCLAYPVSGRSIKPFVEFRFTIYSQGCKIELSLQKNRNNECTYVGLHPCLPSRQRRKKSRRRHPLKRFFFSLLAILILIPLAASSKDTPVLAQKPALGRTHIVFVYAGDLWRVPREGGAAQRLTTGPGVETNPAFSPDGAWIAFTGEYDGNVDVFIMPAEGGEPRRLTWHPASDVVLEWTPDGKAVLFTSGRTAYSRFSELFTVGIEGGLPERLPLPMGYEGSFSPDGKKIAYVPLRRAFNVWKRYRGGTATPVWIADLADSSIIKIPRTDSNDYEPMWFGDKVFFLSDRGAPSLCFHMTSIPKN